MQKSKASRTSCTSYEVIFDLEELQKELDKIEKTMAQADFWQKSQEEITRLSQQRVFLRGSIDQWNKYYHDHVMEIATGRVQVLDHVIVGEKGFCSMKEQGLF